MFACKLLFRYAIKPIRPPQNLISQEANKRLKPKLISAQHPVTNTFKNNTINKCTVAKSSIVQRNFVKHFGAAKAIVRLLKNQDFVPPPHNVGALPKGRLEHKITPSEEPDEPEETVLKTETTVIRQDEKAKQREVEQKVEEMKVEEPKGSDSKDENEEIKEKIVINIYLDPKQLQLGQQDFVQQKTKGLSEESVEEEEEEKLQSEANKTKLKQAKSEKESKEIIKEKIPSIVKEVSKKTDQKKLINLNSRKKVGRENIEEALEDEKEPVIKQYEDTKSTIAPRIDRLPPRFSTPTEHAQRIKDVITKMRPVNTSGFSKYLYYWRQMFAKKDEATNEKDISKSHHHKIKKEKKHHPYEPKRGHKGKDPFKPFPKGKKSLSYDQRRYSTDTVSNENEVSCETSKRSTNILVSELKKFHTERKYSTMSRSWKRCDENVTKGSGAESGRQQPKNKQTRVEEFVRKFKKAVANELKDFKKVGVLYPKKQEFNKHAKMNISKFGRNNSAVRFERDRETETKSTSDGSKRTNPVKSIKDEV